MNDKINWCKIQKNGIELMNLFEFNKEDIEFMKSLKEDRIQSQYYLKEKKLNDENKVKLFVLKCKKIIELIE